MATWAPTGDDLAAVIIEQNPWQSTGSVSSSLAPPWERQLVQTIATRVLDERPRRHHLVLGPRRVGKTTVLYQVVRRLHDAGEADRLFWARLDHPILMNVPLDALVRMFLDQCPAVSIGRPLILFLDELAYAEDWDLWLKTFHDDGWPVRVVGSSSASSALSAKRHESGVGRWVEHRLSPLLLGEYLALRGRTATAAGDSSSLSASIDARLSAQAAATGPEDWRRLMLVGGFPELLLHEPGDEADDVLRAQSTLRSDAVERAIYKDIPQSFGIGEPMALERLLYVLAGQVGGLLSPTNLSSDLGISQPTIDKYVSYLERAFIVFTTQSYAGSETATQRRGRKLFFHDTAVRNAALQRGVAPLDNPGELGHLTENMVVAHLRTLGDLTQVRVHHWREGGREVDVVFGHPTDPLAFEVGLDPTHSRAGLDALLQRHPELSGRAWLVARNAQDRAPGASGIGTISVTTLLLAVSDAAAVAVDQG